MRKLLLALAALAACALAVPLALASSHREAPGISLDPSADNTDTYAWTAQDAPGALTVAANWIPGEVPAERAELPLVRPRARYYIHIDNTGDGKPDVSYRFQLQDEGPQQGVVPVRAPGRQRVRRLEAERHPALLDRARDASLPPRARPREGEDGRARAARRSAQHRAEDVPELRQLRERSDPHARRRHQAVRRPARRSVLRRPRGDLRRDQRPQAHRQPGRGQGRPERIQRPLDRHAAARAAGDEEPQGRLGS